MNATPFREPGTVDKTEIECARIREDGATARERIVQREETKRSRGAAWVIPWVVAGVATCVMALSMCEASETYFEKKYPRMGCVDESWGVDGFQRTCSTSGAVMTVKDGLVMCSCVRTAPAASAQP